MVIKCILISQIDITDLLTAQLQSIPTDNSKDIGTRPCIDSLRAAYREIDIFIYTQIDSQSARLIVKEKKEIDR